MAEDADLLSPQQAICALNSLFRVLPVPGKTQEFFRQTPAEVCRRLQALKCLPTETGIFCRPVEAVTGFTRALFSARHGQELPGEAQHQLETMTLTAVRRLGLNFVHEAVAIPADLVESLGLRTFDVSLLCDLLINEVQVGSSVGEEERGCLLPYFAE